MGEENSRPTPIMVEDKGVEAQCTSNFQGRAYPSSYFLEAPCPKALRGPPPVDKPVDILEVFKEVKINTPLLEVIKQILAYAKYLKDLCTYKRKVR